MEISQKEFAVRLGTTPKTVSELVRGECNLSNDLARKVSSMLGTSVEVWLNLQKTYDQKMIEIEQRKQLDEQICVMADIDYSYFVRVAKLPNTRSATEKVSNLCRFLQISNLNILRNQDFLVNFRSSEKNTKKKT